MMNFNLNLQKRGFFTVAKLMVVAMLVTGLLCAIYFYLWQQLAQENRRIALRRTELTQLQSLSAPEVEPSEALRRLQDWLTLAVNKNMCFTTILYQSTRWQISGATRRVRDLKQFISDHKLRITALKQNPQSLGYTFGAEEQ